MSAAVASAEALLAEESREDAFAAFYQSTARDLWAYLAAASGDRAAADDLTQEAFLRWLRAPVVFESDEHRRRYLFRIASNLLQDKRRAARRRPELPLEPAHPNLAPGWGRGAERAENRLADERGGGEAAQVARHDMARALARLRPRDRRILWLAHVEEASHAEIATMIGARAGSVRVLLFRARQRLARALGARERA